MPSRGPATGAGRRLAGRRCVVALVGSVGLVLGLAACGGSADQPGTDAQPGAGQSAPPSPGQQAGSPEQELAGIGSTLDAIDGELAADGSP